MENALPVSEFEDIANVDIGEALRLVRIGYGQSIADIEGSLRIRSCQIDAIERGDIGKLPGRVYAIGFVRSYAEYLGLDGGKVVQLFIAQYMDTQHDETLSFPTPANEARTPAVWLVVACIAGAILLFMFVGKGDDDDVKSSEIMEIKDVPEDIKTHIEKDILVKFAVNEGASVDPIMADPKEVVVEDMGGDAVQKTGIILNITNDSWVEIKNGEGKVLVSTVLKEGDQYFVPDRPDLSMTIGNAANVEIILGGNVLKPLGGEGSVRRNIPLNSAYLSTLDFVDAP